MPRKTYPKTKPRSVSLSDKSIGEKVRARRLEAGLSQDDLGKALGVSFQQVQKYEKGSNRVSASRLGDIAKILGESMSYFTGVHDTPTTSKFTKLLTDPPSQRLLTAFALIPDQATRYKIVGLVESMTKKAA